MNIRLERFIFCMIFLAVMSLSFSAFPSVVKADETAVTHEANAATNQAVHQTTTAEKIQKLWESTGLNAFIEGFKDIFGLIDSRQITFNTDKIDDVIKGSDYSFSLNAMGGSDDLAYSISGGKLPEGLKLSSYGVITGFVERNVKSGTYNVQIEAKDYQDADSKGIVKSFSINLLEKKVAASKLLPVGFGQIIMIMVSLLLIYLAIKRGFEPLLLLPIGFGGILANIPVAEIAGPHGFLGLVYGFGIKTGLFPLLIFMGVGAMTDFGPLIANPKTALLGAAAQFGIFTTLIGALWISGTFDFIHFSVKDAASIGIIGGADGPTAIFLASKLSPNLLGAIAVAAYSYMALVPIIQPPIMRALTTKEERCIEMKQLRHVKKIEKIIFPLLVLGLCILLLPDATPLMGVLMFGNLLKECGVVERLSKTAANELINIVTILLGLSVGSKLAADKFLQAETLGILILGLIAFCVGTAAGVLLAKLMNTMSKDKINPLIGAAGVSAVPMAARVANGEGLKENPHNFLLMHAMGPNVSGVIGSAVAAGVLLALCG